MPENLEDLISQSDLDNASPGDVKKQLRDKKDTTKTAVHNFMLWVFCIIAALLSIGLCLCVLSYFCSIIRGDEVPAPLAEFLGKIVEWVLISGASFFAALKIRDFCD